MGIKKFFKEALEGILSPGPVAQPRSYHREGFDGLHKTLTGNNTPASHIQRDNGPAVRK